MKPDHREFQLGMEQRLGAGSLGATCGRLLPCALGLLLFAGCNFSLPQAQTDPTKFYVLAAPEAPLPAAPANAPAIRLRRIEIPGYLESKPMAVRRGPNEVEYHEFAQWGEPLDEGIARVVREELLARGAASLVQTGVLRPSDMADVTYDVAIRVLACEGDANGTVDFHAAWTVTGTGDNPTVVAHGEYRATGQRWTPRHEASLAAALSRAATGLADDIAAGLPKPK